MDRLIKIFKALGDKNRLRIVKMLQVKQLCVCEITAMLELATSTVSKHLSLLKEAGIIADRKDGKWAEYRLNSNVNNLFVDGLMPLVKNWLNDERQIQKDKQKLERTDRDLLCRE